MKSKTERLFGEFVFTDKVMKKYLDPFSFHTYKKIKNNGSALTYNIAQKIAKAVMKWAKDKKATHYTHWFMPLTNQSAGKQVSFIEPTKGGRFVEKFSAKDLIKGETDASSFPNGGERMTFEARGYTVWDYRGGGEFIATPKCAGHIRYTVWDCRGGGEFGAIIKCAVHIRYTVWDYWCYCERGATIKCGGHIRYTVCIAHIRWCCEFGAISKCVLHIRYTAWNCWCGGE